MKRASKGERHRPRLVKGLEVTNYRTNDFLVKKFPIAKTNTSATFIAATVTNFRCLKVWGIFFKMFSMTSHI